MSSHADKPEVKVFKFGEESLSDVVFVVGGEEFHCHKMALAARSPYFAALFTSSFKEKNEERIEIEADPAAFRRLMEILYNGVLDGRDALLTHYSYTPNCCYDEMKSRIEAFWSNSCALFELADRFLVLDIVRKVFELLMIATNRNCESRDCRFCATKLLLALRFQMSGFRAASKAGRIAIRYTFPFLQQIQKEFTFSNEAMQFLMDVS